MKSGVELSIIIPTYNSEKYILKCLESIWNIIGIECEIIVVDDGSYDNTIGIVKEITKDHSNIINIKQEHKGRQRARLAGIAISKGKYISFLDSDDWVDEGFFERLVEVMEKDDTIDVAIGSIVRNYYYGAEGPYHSFSEEKIMLKDEAINAMLSGEGYKWELCSKVYRKGLFEMELPADDIQICEDLDWNWKLFNNIRKAYYTPQKKYHYYLNEDSTTQNTSLENMTQHIVYRRIMDGLSIKSEYYQFFLKSYIKMMPRLMLETMMVGQPDDLNRMKEYRRWFCDAESGLEDDSFFDYEMKEAILKSDDSCVSYFVKQIHLLKSELKELDGKFDKVYLYGTGFIAAYISRWIDYFDISISGYVVSDGMPNQRRFYGRDVFYLSEVKDSANKAVFVLSLVNRIQKKVYEYLLNNNCNNCYFMNTSAFADG